MASYPTSTKTFTTRNPGDTIASAHINDLQNEVTAIEQDLLDGNVFATKITTGLNASAVSTGTLVNARLDANVLLTTSTTGINASALSTGTIPNDRISGTYTNLTANNSTYAFEKSEVNLNVNSATQATNATNLNSQPGSYYTNASNLNTGTVLDARLAGAYTNITSLSLGANVIANVTTIFVGNSTANAVRTPTSLSAANSTNTAALTPISLTLGTQITNTTGFYAGANVYANVTTVFVGNSTVNTQMTTTGFILPSVIGLISNQVNQLVNIGGQLFFNGQRVSTVGPYSTTPAVYGYALGGRDSTPAVVNTADQIVFSTGITSACTTSNLITARHEMAAVSDTTIYGYTMGGTTAAGGAGVTTTDRTTFSSTATSASTVSNVSQGRRLLSGFSDGAIYGYAMGGFTGSGVVTTDRITFSNSVTAASTVTNLPSQRLGGATISDGSIYGYFFGGSSTGSDLYTTGYRIAFSTSIIAASTISNLSLARSSAAHISDGAVYGYIMGGSSSGGQSTTTDRITFSTSVTGANSGSNLSAARNRMASISDGVVYGYVMGGQTAATADRIAFSTSITGANSGSNLSSARSGTAGLSDGAV